MIKIFVNIKLWLEKKRYKRYFKKNPLAYSATLDVCSFRPLLVPRQFRCTSFSYAQFFLEKQIAEEYNLDEKRLYFADKTARL